MAPDPLRRPRYAFLAERQIGIGSVAAVVRRHVESASDADVVWTDVTYEAPGAPLGWLPGLPPRLRGVLSGIGETSRGLARGPFDAILFLTQNPAVFRPLTLLRTPTVLWTDVTPLQLDGMAWAYGHPVGSPGVERAKRAVVTATFRLARRAVGWSDWTRRSFVADYGVPERRTSVVPPAIDVAAWAATDRSARRGPLRLAFVGGHFERKGGRLLLEVFRERLRGRAELAVVTRDAVPAELGVTVHRNLAPGSAALRAVLEGADVFVLPTQADCHSVAALEAMASGLPVVLGAIGAGPDIVDEGRTGYLVGAQDGRALGDRLARLADDRGLASALGRAGRERVLREFDGPVVARRLLAELALAARRDG